MTTSNTYNFNPSLSEVVIYAYNLCGIRSTSLLQEHMESAKMATNLMLSRWANQGVNLWAVELVPTITLIEGQATYSVDSNTVMVLDAYVTTINGGTNTDRIILPISRTEYASYPNKEQQGFPTVYWFDRLISPTISLWPVPDGSGNPGTLSYYKVRQIQDANIAGGENVEIPYRWYEAFATGLAYRLSQTWAPQSAAMLKAVADEAYEIAAAQDTEYASMYISPQINGYFRA
jgi:hypothetical protein